MDLYGNDATLSAMKGNLREQSARQHNERVDMARRYAARQIQDVEAQKRDKETQDSLVDKGIEIKDGAGGFFDSGAAARAGQRSIGDRATRIKKATDELDKTMKAVKSTTGHIKEVSNAAKSVLSSQTPSTFKPDLTAPKGSIYNPVGSAEDVVGDIGKASIKDEMKQNFKVGKSLVEAEGLEGVGKLALKNAGSIFNIGAGAEALSEDFKGGQFHLAGKNGLEQASNVLQIASGVADVVGLAFPPAAAVGALLGVASAVTDGLGTAEEEKQTKQQTEMKASKKEKSIKTDVKKLGPKLDPEKERMKGMASVERGSSASVVQSRAAG